MAPSAAAGMQVERDLVVIARDGVRLATDVYRPVEGGPFPVLLERTPYDKSAPSRSERTASVATPRSRAEVAAYFVSHGYAVVYQDSRGRYQSSGRFTKYWSEATDGCDTLAWLVRQPWCNGRVGTFGLSYAAHTQAALGCLDPPGLAAQFLDCGGFSNAYRSGIRHDGAFDLKQATWAYNNALADAKDPAVKQALAAQDIKAWFARMPWRKGASPLSAAPDYEDYLFEQWSHGRFDDFWKQPGIWAEGYWDRYAAVPITHLSGWYDPYARTAVENYVGLSRRGRAPNRLILGPWTHGDRSLSYTPARSISARPQRLTAISRKIFLHCAGAGSTTGSKGSTMGPPPSRRCGYLSWAADRGDATLKAGSTMVGGGWKRPPGHCRKPSRPRSISAPTIASGGPSRPPRRRRSPSALIHGIRCRRSAVHCPPANR